ncbi:hypothetical protein V496_01058 [Pseudogymnoascus sp. VKM F-4515 (FW-2607)]|nr:hypothetical protein V496_01058 [Pseudogymnoascus sp. VKM F-4515 (FW-2607)]
MNDSATQIEEHLTSLQPSLDELECLGDPDLLWPEKGQPWPPSVERYVHRFMHETNLYQVYRSTEVKFGKLVRLLATQVLPARSIKIHDSIARRCKQLITQSSRRWYSAGWLGLRGKTYYKKDPFQQCWNTHAAALAAKSIAVREDPRKKVLSVPELLLSNADGDGQAKRDSDEPLQHPNIPAKRNCTTFLEAKGPPEVLICADIDSLKFRSSFNRPTTLAPIPELVEEATPNTYETIPTRESPASQTFEQAIIKEASQPLPSTEIEPRASHRPNGCQTDAWICQPGTTERRLGDQSCRIGAQTLPIFKPQDRNSSRPPLYVASPTLSSGPGASERGFLTPPIEHNRHRSALASFPRVGSSLTAAPASLHRANLPRANTRFATALASLPRIDTSIITPPSPDTPPQPVKKWLTTAPASLPPVNTDLATFEVANYLAPPQIYLFRTVARLLVQKLGEASAYSLLDTLMSFNLSAFFSWYAQIMRVDDVPALVFKLLGTQPSQSQGIVVIRDTPEAFRHLKHSICKAFKARADTGQGSDAFRVVVLPYPILTTPQIPVQRVSSSVEVLVRIQVTPEGNFSEPYHFNMIGAMRTTEDFFSWFSMEARYKQSSGVQALSFCFKDAAPSPITNCIERGNAQQFEYMKGDIQRRCYETLAYMPRMREFTVLVAVPGWIVPGWTVPRSMMPEERGLRFSNP